MKIFLKNFRLFENKKVFKLNKLNILIGRNNSGKSTFMRIFPLLKQTYKSKVSEPILWYGNEVDFGSYKDAKNFYKKDNKEPIELGIDLENKTDDFFSNLSVNFQIHEHYIKEIEIKSKYFSYCAKMSSDGKDNKISSLKINNKNVSFKDNEINYVNKNPSLKNNDDFVCCWHKHEDEIIPYINNINSPNDFFDENKLLLKIEKLLLNNEEINSGNKIMSKDFEITFLNLFFNFKFLHNNFLHSKKHLMNKKWIEELIDKISENITKSNQNKKNTKSNLSNQKNTIQKNYKNNKEIIDVYIIMYFLNPIISLINSKLKEIFLNVIYLKPIRANIERFYRKQGLYTNSINSDGSNIAMILFKDKKNNNLTHKTSFSKWCKEKLNLEIFAKEENENVSLFIKEDKDNEINIVDSGYGFSQLLPILWTIWDFSKKIENNIKLNKKLSKSSFFNLDNQKLILIIEQPELHLHPALQSKFAELIAKITNESLNTNLDIHIIVETHSETIINKIGDLVSENNTLKDYINLVLFNKKNHTTKIKTIKYDEKGIIQEWPIGFFE